jgi:hypothetical protein
MSHGGRLLTAQHHDDLAMHHDLGGHRNLAPHRDLAAHSNLGPRCNLVVHRNLGARNNLAVRVIWRRIISGAADNTVLAQARTSQARVHP